MPLVWFRKDLRVHDHPALTWAMRQGPTIAVYCFDPREFAETAYGFPKTSAFRAQFLIESVADLRESLKRLGVPLLVRVGKPEEVLPELTSNHPAQLGDGEHARTWVWHDEPGTKEAEIAGAVKEQAVRLGVPTRRFVADTLVLRQALPFELEDLPMLFTAFRKEVERDFQVRAPLPAPSPQTALRVDHDGKLPKVSDLLQGAAVAEGASLFNGGESAGKMRVKQYLWDGDHLRRYKETRNGMLRPDDSSKFSPWLAHGCLSPRWIFAEIRRYERDRIANESTYWLIFELLWRDYFHFSMWKFGPAVFRQGGIQKIAFPWSADDRLFEAWCQGNTGYPLVDANMKELLATGYMSNRGRQIVASFFCKALGLDWRMGAAWFESLLVDYDPASNYGNWQYVAGIGHDGREFRVFNLKRQGEMYDPKGEYIQHWLPEYRKIGVDRIHLPESSRKARGLAPIVDFSRAVEENRKKYEKAAGKAAAFRAAAGDRDRTKRKN